MPHSLRSRIKKFHHQGILSDKDRDRILNALDYEWILTTERLPECEKEVLVCTERKVRQGITKKIITSAFYEDGTKSEFNSIWHWQDVDFEKWDEENDCGIIPEGWWEFRHYNPDEVYNNVIDDYVVAWMPLPVPYCVDKVAVSNKGEKSDISSISQEGAQ